MHRPLVHIGYHKTATTWFQRQFYPRVTNGRYVPQLDVIAAFKDADVFRFDPGAFRRRLNIADELPPIICDETLCGVLRDTWLRGVKAWHTAQIVKQALPDADIVIFVRSQPDMLAAHYREYVRSGGTRSPARFFGLDGRDGGSGLHLATTPTTDLGHFEYDRLIDHYDQLFGRERVHVHTFEDFQRDPGDMAARFARQFALRLDCDDLAVLPENTGYGARTLKIARVLNAFGQSAADEPVRINIPGWYRVSHAVLRRVNASSFAGLPPGADALFGTATVEWLRARYAASNRRLLSLRDLPLGELGYPL